MTEKNQNTALATQLRCPTGELGLKVAQNMSLTNNSMIQHAIQKLELQENNTILEIGHGDAQHVGQLFDYGLKLTYHGIDISALMTTQAIENNRQLVTEKTVHFLTYNGSIIPFSDNTFDAIFSVNTVYFWENINRFFGEIIRVARKKARFALTFADPAFMKTLPYVTSEVFTLYTPEEIEQIAKKTALMPILTEKKEEQILNKMGNPVQRVFYTMLFIKS